MQDQRFRNDTLDLSIFKNRSDTENALAAPYTIFMKKLSRDIYSWVAYSIGRPRNIIWGIVNDYGDDPEVEYGCSWNSLKIINDMMAVRQKAGYVAVSTYAKNRISHRILRELIPDAYENGTDASHINAWELQEAVIDELAQNDLPDTYENVLKVADTVARKFVLDKNKKQKLSNVIPDHVINALHDYIGHNPNLNSNIPGDCPLLDECDGSNEAVCGLYGDNYGLL